MARKAAPIPSPTPTNFMTEKEVEEHYFTGRDVRYVPAHAKGDPNHKDCENGKVSSVRRECVFVKFSSGSTAAACHYSTLL